MFCVRQFLFVCGIAVAGGLAILPEKTDGVLCFEKESAQPEKKPPVSIPSRHKLQVQVFDQLTNRSFDVTELGDADALGVLLQNGTASSQFMFARAVNGSYLRVDDGDACATASDEATSAGPLDMPADLRAYFGAVGFWRGSEALLDVALSADTKQRDANGTRLHGLPAARWVGCRHNSTADVFLQVDVIYSEGAAPQLLQIQVRTYKNVSSAAQMLSFAIYELSFVRADYSPQQRETLLMPPRGVYCEGLKSARTMPNLPSRFSTRIESIDPSLNTTFNSDVAYDGANQLIAFTYAQSGCGHFFDDHLDLPAGRTFAVVHDFKRGVEYATEARTARKEHVKALPQTAGDATLGGSGRKLTLRSAADLLLNSSAVNYTYLGSRLTESGALADVWIGKSDAVYEAWFSREHWTMNGSHGITQGKGTLLRVVLFRHTAVGKSTSIEQRFADFSSYGADPFALSAFDVSSCSKLSNDSHVYVMLRGTSEESLAAFGLPTVWATLRDALAHAADVSPLRVWGFYARAQPGGVAVLFVLADATGVASVAEKSTAQAVAALNKTLAADVNVTVVGALTNLTLTVGKQSLRRVPVHFTGGVLPPPPPPPPQISQGYSGGSMFLVSLIMLVVGGIGGVLLAWYMWKRNRGIAYQIYE